MSGKEILKKQIERKLTEYLRISTLDLNTYREVWQKNHIKQDIEKALVEISIIQEDKENAYLIKVTDRLITNDWFCKFLNCSLVNYVPGDTYLFFNCINQDNVIRYDVESGMYYVKRGYENYPVQGVNWYGALLFSYMCDGRLLTELEYENIVTKIDTNLINYGNLYGFTTDVNKFPPNELNIYDSMGNLRVWCMDMYSPNCKNVCNKSTELFHNTYYRVVKGNAWDKTDIHLNKYLHEGKWPRVGTMGIGFRVVFSEYPINFC